MPDAQAVALALEPESTSEAQNQAVSATDIANLAYQLWQERGSPIGSPEEDWFRAEELLAAGVNRS